MNIFALITPVLFAAAAVPPVTLPADCERYLDLAAESPGRRLDTFDPADPARRLRFAAQKPDLRLFAIQTLLASFTRRGRVIGAASAPGIVDPATQFYDVAFIGAGAAETTAQWVIERRRPDLKTVTYETSSSVANTFFSTRGFFLNSTDGTLDPSDRPLPNRGLNLNQIPGAPLQTSSLTAGKYTEAGVFGDVVALNRLALPRPIRFQESVTTYFPTPEYQRERGYPAFTIRLASGRVDYAEVVMDGSGLGTERSVARGAVARAFVEDDWNRYLVTGQTPRYFTSSRLFAFVNHNARWYEPFVDKTVLFLGDGNFSLVNIELFEREGPESIYRNNPAATGRYRGGFWIGPRVPADCRAFTQSSRSRYLRGVPAALQKERVLPRQGRVMDVAVLPSGQVEVAYRAADGTRQTVVVDFVIDSTGYVNDRLPPAKAGTEVYGDLPETGRTIVGRQVAPGAFLMGSAARVPLTDGELANNPQNGVSLYSNLARVAALTDQVIDRFADRFGRHPDLPVAPLIAVGRARAPSWIEIELINPNDFVKQRDFAPAFLDAQVAAALDGLDLPRGSGGRIDIVSRVTEGASSFLIGNISVDGNGYADAAATTAVGDFLSATPAFLSVLDEEARAGRLSLRWVFEKTAAGLRVRASDVAASATPTIVGKRIVQGFAKPAPLRYQEDVADAARVAVPARVVTAEPARVQNPARVVTPGPFQVRVPRPPATAPVTAPSPSPSSSRPTGATSDQAVLFDTGSPSFGPSNPAFNNASQRAVFFAGRRLIEEYGVGTKIRKVERGTPSVGPNSRLSLEVVNAQDERIGTFEVTYDRDRLISIKQTER